MTHDAQTLGEALAFGLAAVDLTAYVTEHGGFWEVTYRGPDVTDTWDVTIYAEGLGTGWACVEGPDLATVAAAALDKARAGDWKGAR